VSPTEWRQKSLALFAVILALLANANGWEGIFYPFTLYQELRGHVSSFPDLIELRSPFSVSPAFPHPVTVYKVLLALSVAALLLAHRRLRLAHLFPFLLFLFLSTQAIRNMALFAVVATPVAIRGWRELLGSWRSWREREAAWDVRVAGVTALCMVALTGVIWTSVQSGQLYREMGFTRRFGFELAPKYPSELPELVAAMDGRVFNSPDLGGFLIWKLYPRKQVAVDGRWEIYGAALPELRAAFYRKEVFAQLVARYDIRGVVLGSSPVAKRMAAWLRLSENWELVADDRYYQLYERL